MAREPQHRQPEGVKFEQPKPADVGLFGADPVVAPAEDQKVDGWLDLPKAIDPDRFPFNGAPILLRSVDGDTAEAVFRFTRRFVVGRWEPAGFWAKRNAGGARLGFEPVAYRKIED